MKRKILAIMCLFVLGACPTIYAESTTEPGQIAFVSVVKDEGRNKDIFVINADGTGLTRLTDSELEDTYPMWSPDGSKILYVSEEPKLWNSKTELWIMNRDGSNKIKIAEDIELEYSTVPRWSPDSKWVVYIDDETERLVLADAISGETKFLTEEEQEVESPVWSPDGTKILCALKVDKKSGVYLLDPFGTEKVRLSETKGTYSETRWSPDGSKIAFVFEKPLVSFGKRSGMYVVDVESQAAVYLGKGEGIRWTPEGKSIFFLRVSEPVSTDPQNTPPKKYSTFMIDVDGQSVPVQVAERFKRPLFPVLSPDGQKMAYIDNFKVYLRRSGDSQVYVYNVPYAMDDLSNLAWSQDSNRFVCIGYTKLIGSKATLFVVDIRDGSVTQITGEEYDDFQATWAPIVSK